MKQLQLSVEKARELYGISPELNIILQETFSEEELGLKKPLPKTWYELMSICGYSTTELDSKLRFYRNLVTRDDSRNLFATEAQAKSAIAYAQLTQLMKAYNGDWEPDWEDDMELKYVIDRDRNGLERSSYYTSYSFLAFKDPEVRDKFLENFQEIIKVFYQID